MQCTINNVISDEDTTQFCDQWISKRKYNKLAIGGETKFELLYIDFEIFGSRFDNTIMDRIYEGDGWSTPAEENYFIPVKRSMEAIKYLGFYLDPALNWKYHCQQVLKQCQKSFYSIQVNLGKVWRISTSIAWRLLDACVLSILDYSAIIFCNCLEGSSSNMEGTLYSLNRFYKH